jgi:D-3-phosphoglycerate dehydrogenase
MFKRLIASLVCFTFILSNLQYVRAQDFSINQLPVPGTMVGVSTPFEPLSLKGLIVNPQKPLEFQFIVDTGKGPQDTVSIKDQANQLVKYFLAGLTIPEGDLWVNLSPYEKNRMVPAALGQTDLGRDLLAQDYILKQLTASLIYPEKDLGKEFWSRVNAKAQQQFGTTNIPVNTFNKVWILPDQAQVFERGASAYVTKATLKVMLDEDYLARQKHQQTQASSISSQIIREIVIPEVTKEVNTGKNFAPLRQIYQALILAKWYKENIQNGLLDAIYTNKNKVAGVNLNDSSVKEQIYNRYLQAYKKGVFNFIKEDSSPDGQTIPRKYFSGGVHPIPDHVRTDGAMSAVTVNGAMAELDVNLENAAMTVAGREVAVLDSMNIGKLGLEGIHDLSKAADKLAELKKLEGIKVLIVRSATIVNEEMIDALPDLKLIIRAGHGLDNIKARKYAEAKGIEVRGTLGSEKSVSALAMRMVARSAKESMETIEVQAPEVLGTISGFQTASDKKIAKRPAEEQALLRAKAADLFRPVDRQAIEGKTIGIIGYGTIGKEIAAAAKELGMKVLVNSMSLENNLSSLDGTGYSFATKEQIYGSANFVLLITGLVKSGPNPTAGMVDEKVVALLKGNGRLRGLINPDREGLVVEPAIEDLLNARPDVSYIVDEFPKSEELKKKAIYTDHIGASTQEAEDTVVANTASLLKEIPANWAANRIEKIADEAMVARTAIERVIEPNLKGGIDLNQINVNRTGKTINVQFDGAQLNALEQSDFKGFTPVITGFQYIQSPYPLLGIHTPAKEPEELVKT